MPELQSLILGRASAAADRAAREASASQSLCPLGPHSVKARTSVLHLIVPGEAGGAESMVAQLSTAQKALGAEVTVAAVVEADSAASDFVTVLRERSVDVHRICVIQRDYRREKRLISELCRAMSPDILHSHGYRTDIIDALSLRHRLPIVSTVHGFTGGDLRNRFYQWLQCVAYSRFDAVVAVSQPLRPRLRRWITTDRLHVVPNAYDAEKNVLSRATARGALGLPNDAFVVGWVGRFSHEKGPDLFIEALASAACPMAAHAVIIGEGAPADSLRDRASRLGIDGRISWKGRVANASRLFAAFDVLVLSSRTEGTPMVILEAMAAETPIVATRVGGVPDMLPPGAGLLVPSESAEELAGAIRNVFINREAAVARACTARSRLDENYAVTTWVERHEEIYACARRVAAGRLRR